MTSPTGFTRALTNLGSIEDKIRRALGLVGDVGLSWSPNAVPVVVVADATAAGAATFRGRRFYASLAAGGAGVTTTTGFKATGTDPLVITSIRCQGTATQTLTLRLADASVADPYAMARLVGQFVERNTGSGDVPPLVGPTVIPGAATTAGQIVCTVAITNNANVEMLTQPIVLTQNQKLLVSTSAIGDVTINVAGYVF